MKKIVCFILCALLLATSLVSCKKEEETEGVKLISGESLADNDYIKWEGRYAASASSVTLYHTASGFSVDFVGTALYVEFESVVSDNSEKHYPYYNVAVDGEVIPTAAPERTFHLTGGKQRIAIVEGLEQGKHTVKCLKMSEPYDAATSVLSFETDGAFEARDREYDAGNFRFLVVCASGGSGYGSLAYSENGGNCSRTSANSSSLHAFNYLTARMFDADVQFVAHSGWGVAYPQNKAISKVLDHSGITITNSVDGAKTTAAWDHAKWVPDVILFNIGGNDTTKDGFDQSVYQKEVVAMVQKFHELYPNAYMVWTHTNSNAGKFAVAAMTDAGILKEGYMQIVIIPKVGADGTEGAADHNSFKTHITTADIIADALSKQWGFTRVRDNVKFEDFESKLQKFG